MFIDRTNVEGSSRMPDVSPRQHRRRVLIEILYAMYPLNELGVSRSVYCSFSSSSGKLKQIEVILYRVVTRSRGDNERETGDSPTSS